VDAVDVRAQNLATVMHSIFTGQVTTRNALAEATGLTRMTITNLTTELLSHGILVEETPEVSHGRPGRVSKLLRLAPDSPVVAGIWQSKSFLYGVVADLSLQVQLGRQVPLTDADTADTVLEKARALAEGLLESTVRPVAGFGLALSGVVNTTTGAIERITDFHGIDELPLTEYLREHLQLPIFADNMMHASALAEYHYGIGRTVPDFIYVGLSEGVGAAVVSGGRKVGSVHASGGEFGHMSIDYRGPACSCGSRGCLELYASMPRLIAGINAACGTEYVTAKEALAVCLTDEKAGAVLVEVLDTLAIGVNNLVNLLDVFTVVIGDDSAHIPDSYLAGMEDELNEISLFRGFHHITVLKSGFGDSAPLFGSVALVMERIFTGDHPLW